MPRNMEIYDLEFAAVGEADEITSTNSSNVDLPSTEPVLNGTNQEGSDVDALYALDFAPVAVETEPKPNPDEVAAQMAVAMLHEVLDIQPAKPPVEIPQAIIELASLAISKAITSDAVIVPFSQLAQIAYESQNLSGQGKWLLKQALKRSPELEYLGEGRFGVAERLSPDNYWPGQVEGVDQEKIDRLVQSTIQIMASGRQTKFNGKHIMGIVSFQGERLSPEEYDQFMIGINTHPALVPQEDGSSMFIEAPPKSEKPPTSDEVVITFKKPREEHRSSKEIRRTLNDINKSPEIKYARDLGKNLADPRRMHSVKHKRRKGRVQGRAHGKAKTVEQMIAEMNKPKDE